MTPKEKLIKDFGAVGSILYDCMKRIAREAVREDQDQQVKANSNAEEWASKAQALDMLKCRSTKLYSLRKSGMIGYTKNGRTSFFYIPDIRAYLELYHAKALKRRITEAGKMK